MKMTRGIVLRPFLLLAGLAATVYAAEPSWLDLVAPVITPMEKKTWIALSQAERVQFEQSFWANKSISGQEYFQRLAYADATWGGPKHGSSANTDPGRVYLALGPPNRISRFPSSRIFVTLEIWYYSAVPGVIDSELRLIFFRKNNVNPLELYSPTNDTIRALLLNESGTRTMFGPNDIIDENMIRQNLNVPPAEDEIISASVNVGTGIRDVGNEEILGQVMSPRLMLTRRPETSVKSHFFVDRPNVSFLLSPSSAGGLQVDLSAEVTAQRQIGIEVLDDKGATVYRNVLNLHLAEAKPAQYIQRIDLLPGSYRVIAKVDGRAAPYSLDVPAEAPMSGLLRMAEAHASVHTPFEFDDNRYYPDANGRFVLVVLRRPGEVRWSIRQNGGVVWRQITQAKEAAVLALPLDRLHPGHYRVDAETDDDAKSLDLDLSSSTGEGTGPYLLSFNANLSTAARQAQIGHQFLLRGRLGEAGAQLEASIDAAPTEQARIDLARLDAITGRWDNARDRVRDVLAQDPKNFEALCVYAFVEAGLQDYVAATRLYQRALAIEDSPAIRLALSKLPER